MKDKLLEGAYYAFFGWLDIDDGTELGFAYNLVVLWLAAANADDSFLHGFEGIHRGGVCVELVQDGIGIFHQLGVQAERNAFDDLKLHEVGMMGFHLSGCLEHDVGAFVGGALAVDANEDAHGMVCLGRKAGGRTDGEGNEGGLVGEMGLIAAPVFVESGNDAVAVVCNDSVQLLLRGSQPVLLLAGGLDIGAQMVANVEVAVAEMAALGAFVHPVVVHAKSTKEHLAVVATEITVDGQNALSLEFEEHGVDELHNVVTPETG